MKITIKNLQKKKRISPKRVKKAVLKALSLRAEKLSGEITVCFVNDKKIRQFNLRYLGRDCPTDVIAFNLSKDKHRLLADIAVSTDTAGRNARLFKTSFDYELCLYVIHGVLHLLGFDDSSLRKRRLMERECLRIMSALSDS